MAWLNAAHPPKVGEHTKFVMAKGGTDSCFLSKRIKRIAHNAAKSADLVVFEYAVNDGWRDWMVAGSKAEQRETQRTLERRSGHTTGGATPGAGTLATAAKQVHELQTNPKPQPQALTPTLTRTLNLTLTLTLTP